MTKRRTTMRDERANLAPPPSFTTTCSSCQIDHVSSVATLPEHWRIVRAGVRCPDCQPADPEGPANG